MNPVDHYNIYTSYDELFNSKKFHLKSQDLVMDLKDGKDQFKLHDNSIECLKPYKDHPAGAIITKFMVFTYEYHKGNWAHAASFVQYFVMKDKTPYTRVGVDYFKIINKSDRYGMIQTILKPWKLDTIKQDHGSSILPEVPKFDDFTIVPDNKNYQPVVGGFYNLYNKFSPAVHGELVTETDIPSSMALMSHIFGDQLSYGLTYMKVLYEYPHQILPILTLVSRERQTGKTTFLNWIQMIFGENSVMVSPDELAAQFNSMYAIKNIIMIDEAVSEKTSTLEKLKAITTAKSIMVRTKHIQEYSIPFFGKVILCTNKVKDFMRIDDEEIRFWVRKVSVITNRNTKIEDHLFTEIPKFLKYLDQLPIPDLSKDRMVLTPEEINTSALKDIKDESKSTLRKSLEMLIDTFFDNNDMELFEATATDIKKEWFSFNHKYEAPYIFSILKEEMNIEYCSKGGKYIPFGNTGLYIQKINGKYFTFKRTTSFVKNEPTQTSIHTEIDPPF